MTPKTSMPTIIIGKFSIYLKKLICQQVNETDSDIDAANLSNLLI